MSINAARMVAVDIGAESGRVLAGDFDGDRLSLDEVRRFPNIPVKHAGSLQWNAETLREDVLAGLRAAGEFRSVGIDTWGVDFGLLDRSGNLLGNPGHYRDERTRGMIEKASALVPRQEIYRRTGIQFLEINTLYQLLALVLAGDAQLRAADRLLTMPALVGYWLTPGSVDEHTDATTTQCYDPVAGAWALDLLEKLGIPTHIFGPVIQPGMALGPIRDELDFGHAVVIAPGTHDTASAVAAVPFQPGKLAAYISSGTWSLVGLELPAPLINDATLNANLTNEGGVAGTSRLLKNVMGLWLVQECRRAWSAAGSDYSYEQLLSLAEQARPFVAVIDPDDGRLLRPGIMPAQLVELAAESHQALAADPGAIVRCVLESLAMKYRWTIERLESVTGRAITSIHVVGGGARNALLCQMTADASRRQVLAGPVEATAIGNVMLQAIALGLVDSLEQAREVVRRSSEVKVYEPRATEMWEPAWERFSAAQMTATERRTA
jgi:rhamnulokinase